MVWLILIFFLAETGAIQCEGDGLKCCLDEEWDEFLGKCRSCKPGYFSFNCNQTCKLPFYGIGCQSKCDCPDDKCDFAKGCPEKETSGDVYIPDDVKDSSTTSFTMETMGNLTNDMKRDKDSILLEHSRTWFSTKNISILIFSVVGLILITIAILFTRKVILKIYSERRRKKCYECPTDRLSEPVHYEVISNIVV
ncbi:multiple epidermal growth factor-like domains protein 10 [Crassostrea angulata]|uniref:multiple epidermal growth factor-like domains protein 10 n=1 Tax=Magallana angulata TaxID=2784310 RepID=UPI0022B0D552|nr:multiple epidermal growth factor-like domains protein 10 [Crassostrea angulata]